MRAHVCARTIMRVCDAIAHVRARARTYVFVDDWMSVCVCVCTRTYVCVCTCVQTNCEIRLLIIIVRPKDYDRYHVRNKQADSILTGVQYLKHNVLELTLEMSK